MKKGLVVENVSNLYHVKIDREIYKCNARGKLKQDISPVVGDIVEIEIIDEDSKTGVIIAIEERKNYIKRPKVSNITQMLFVLSCNMPKPDLLLLDKQLAFAEFMNIKPIIVINKIDLGQEEELKGIEKIYTKIGYEVITTCAKEGLGVQKLKEKLLNNISVFAGNSGVGKSTLINALFEEILTDEGEISNKNKKGKNTTTQAKLYELQKDSYIIDAPGFSTFDIYEIESNELQKYFVEFKEYIPECRYIGCNHIKEDECGIKNALEQNKISNSRYQNYIKIFEDIKEKEEHRW